MVSDGELSHLAFIQAIVRTEGRDPGALHCAIGSPDMGPSRAAAILELRTI